MRRAVALCLAVCISPIAFGQDSQLYRVSIGSSVVINALSPTQVRTHPMTAGNVQFFDSRWFVNVNSPAGASVTFEADPFTNSAHTTYQRDVQLRLRRLRNIRGAAWGFDDRVDRTRIASGNNRAVVTMSTDSAGAANVSIRVRFITGADPQGTLAAGNYLTTVVGTIAAN